MELNAIDLAWDTIARFSDAGMPLAFFTDFAHIADDESRHFGESQAAWHCMRCKRRQTRWRVRSVLVAHMVSVYARLDCGAGWCSQRLAELGHAYGDMPAHSILWQGAQASAGDIGARLAIVPLGAEARGLDAGASRRLLAVSVSHRHRLFDVLDIELFSLSLTEVRCDS